jgi:hypothetical protein
MKCTMFMGRTGYNINKKPENNTLKIIKPPAITTKIIIFGKTKILQILKEFVLLKESDVIKSIYENVNKVENTDLQDICLKLALMKIGFMPEKDNSLNRFYQELDSYTSDIDIKEYLIYIEKRSKPKVVNVKLGY